MTDKEFERTAVEISEKMNLFNDKTGTSANFGLITKDGKNYRLFMGGSADSIMNGLAIAVANLIEVTGATVEELFSDLMNDTAMVIEMRKQKGIQ